MAQWKLVASALVLGLGIGSPASANMATYEPRIAGDTMSCTAWNGQPVQVISNNRLETLGRASNDRNGAPVIEMNFAMLNAFSPALQKWWFAHECAHHELMPQLNSEKRADCMAAKRLKKFAGADLSTVADAVQRELSPLAASAHGHLAGAERVQHVLKCAGIRLQA